MAEGVAPREALVDAVEVRRIFPPGEQGIRSATFRISAGSSVSVVGRSGSGKTTLLSLLGMLERPSAGRLRVLGRNAAEISAPDAGLIRRSKLSFIFQAFHLIPHLSVFENVALGMHHRFASAAERRVAVDEQLVALGLEGHADAFPKTLSGGEQQRTAIARALVRRPRLLLCDEPTGNLDSANGEVVTRALLRAVSPETSVVIVTHDEDLAARCTQRIRVHDGRAEERP